MSKIKTIKLGSAGTDYAKVSARLAAFIQANKNPSVKTSYEFTNEYVVFKAIITPDVANPDKCFHGTSMGKMSGLKAFEKLETIAVGRALAFAGYLSDGEIASSEEMIKYDEVKPDVDLVEVAEKLEGASNLDELKKIWQGLTQTEREVPEVVNLKNKIKANYENTQSGAKVTKVARAKKGEDHRNGTEEASR